MKMTLEQLLDQVFEENSQKSIDNINAFVDRIVGLELHPEVVKELDQINKEYGTTRVVVSSGFREFNTEFKVVKEGETWKPDRKDFGYYCEVQIDPAFSEEPISEQLTICSENLKRQVQLLDSISTNTNKDKWQLEY